jgi:hypothetical protein
MAQKEFVYRGRRIAVADSSDDGKRGWTFTIDSEAPVVFKKSPASDAATAIAEASAAACSVVDLRDGAA